VKSGPLLLPLAPYAGLGVLVAVSGGADSVALLRALVQAGAAPTVAHLDHALRPESHADAAFVAALAQQLGLPFVTQRLDVAAVAAQRGWNLEDAARRLRYSFLARAAKQAGLKIMLTAHTRTDQAETVLWQLLRGESVLPGMPPKRGHLERPWLGVSRPEIVAYLQALGQPWREDGSNLDPRFTRNWIRRQVLPGLQARFPGLEASLARLASFQAQDDETLKTQAGAINLHTPLARLPMSVLRRWVRLQLAGQPVHAEHLERIAGALQQGATLHLILPGNVPLSVTGGRLIGASAAPQRLGFNVPGSNVPDFDIPPRWTLRHRLPGDRMVLPAGTRKLSDLLIDLKVPRAWRDQLWLLASDQERERSQEGTQSARTQSSVQWIGLPDGPLWAAGAATLAGQIQVADPEWLAMGEALRLARAAAEAGEVPVGAVVLFQGKVIAGAGNSSREQGDMTRHAELEALRAASVVVGPYLQDCTLVVTLEPCPMCLGAALEARAGRIVYGAANPKAGALGGVSDLLAWHWGHRPEVRAGLRAGESAGLLRQTFASMRARNEPDTDVLEASS
jgi:tRNA(Ile)-lysidine synthase